MGVALKVEHELHQRRKSRNVGVALVLASFIGLIFALTFVKITQGDFELPPAQRSEANQ